MSLEEWLRQGSRKTLAVAFSSALLAGVGTAAYLNLPGYLREPVYTGEPQQVLADDPGRTKWDEVISAMGGLGSTFVIPAAFYSTPAAAPEPAAYEPPADRGLTRLLSQVDAELREAERRDAEWTRDYEWNRRQRMEAARLEQDRRAAEEVRYGYQPVASYGPPRARWVEVQPVETVDAAPADEFPDEEPVPPPPPRPSMGW